MEVMAVAGRNAALLVRQRWKASMTRVKAQALYDRGEL